MRVPALEKNYLDIYQNCGFEYSAAILLVAWKTPLPADGG